LNHFLLVDIPAGFLVGLALYHDLIKHPDVTIGMLIVYAFDLILSLFAIFDLEQGAS